MPYVPPKYPGAIPTTDDLPDREDDIDWLYAARYNELKKELRAALIELGALPKGADADVKARLDRIQSEIDALEALGPGEGHIVLLPPSYNSIGQGTWVVNIGTTHFLNAYLYNSTTADGDNLSWKVYLAAGTYTLLLLCQTTPNRGIIDFDINDAEIASFDTYSAGTIFNVRKTQANISVATSGLYDLKLRLDGKNPSSADYTCVANYIALWRTA